MAGFFGTTVIANSPTFPPNSPFLMLRTPIGPKTFSPCSLGPEICGGASKTGRRNHGPRILGRIPF